MKQLLRHPSLGGAVVFILVILSAVLLGGVALAQETPSGATADHRYPPPAQTPFLGPVPKPKCQPGDRTETGVDGQLTLAERASGASTKPYNCNLEVVGQFIGEGADHQLAWQGDCAYYTTNSAVAGTGDVPPIQFPGVQVIDVSDLRHPFRTANLTDPSFIQPWESLNANHAHHLLGGVEAEGGAGKKPGFVLYDTSDCRHPLLMASVDLPNTAIKGHAGNFTPDGRTYYGTDIGVSVYAVDIDDPFNPSLITNMTFLSPHYITPNRDGTVGYIGNEVSASVPCQAGLQNGLVVVDLSDVQHRLENPQITTISSLFWCDSNVSEVSVPVKIGGKPFLVFTDEFGSARPASVACAAKLPPWGFVRLIDVSDIKHPQIAAKLLLEVSDPANCALTENDIPSGDSYGYSSHDCGVDNVEDAKIIACSYHESGVRVFDIHDPYHPKEIAYWKGPARGTGPILPGSSLSSVNNPTYAWAKARSRFVWHDRELYLWLTSSESGLVIAKFENQEAIRALGSVPSPGNEEPNN